MFGVIFDMDGVLIDSKSYGWSVFKDIARENGGFVRDEDYSQYQGVSWRDVIVRWKTEFGFKPSLEEFTARFEQAETRAFDSSTHLIPGALDFLSMLRTHHVPMSVGTSSHASRAVRLLEKSKIHSFFSGVATADDVPNHKPAPDIFLAAGRMIGVPPARCIVIEDAPAGIEAAHRGGMKAVGFAETSEIETTLHKADLVIRDFSELSYEKLVSLLH